MNESSVPDRCDYPPEASINTLLADRVQRAGGKTLFERQTALASG